MSSKKRKGSIHANGLADAKRQQILVHKSRRQDTGFVEGAVTRIKLENILTYDSVEFFTGAHLNVIIGPNGTGKSTIVCAIYLGLAGKISLLGRAHQPSEYIKFGCNKGKIELELHNPDGDNYVIRREISKNNTSQWMVNGRQASQKVVEEKVARLNIQVGNLCQFLPQEKVADFAKMTQQELLENTEKAAGHPELFESHQKLNKDRTEARRLEQAHTNLNAKLEQERQKNARLEQDVQNFEERKRHLEKIRLLEMKRPWVEYEEKRKLYYHKKTEGATKAEEVKKAQRDNAPLQKLVDDEEKKKSAIDAKMKRKTELALEHAKLAQNKSKEIDVNSDKINDSMEDIKYKQQDEEIKKRQINDIKRQLERLNQDLASLTDAGDIQPALDKVNDDIRRVNRTLTTIQQQGENIRMEINKLKQDVKAYQRELQVVQDVSNRRLETLRQKHLHTYNAVLWLRSNRQMFKATIHEPLLLVLNVKNPSDAKYIEAHVSYNDMRAFVCEDSDDMELFLSTMRDQQKLKVNAVKRPPQEVSSFVPRVPLNQYSQYGFQCFLKDLFDAPDAVLRYLCLQYRVYDIPVGSEYTKNHVNEVIRKNPQLTSFYTPNNSFFIKKSKYGNKEVASRNSSLKPARFLTVSVDVERQMQLTGEILKCQSTLEIKEKQYRDLKKKSEDCETQMNKSREEKKELLRSKDKKKLLQSQIQSKQQSIRRLESDIQSLDVERGRVQESISGITVQQCQLLKAMIEGTKKYFDTSVDKVRLSLQHAVTYREYTRLQDKLRDESQALQALELQLMEVMDHVKVTKSEAQAMLLVARKATGTGSNEELSPQLKAAFEPLPATLEEIEVAIHEQKTRADCTFQTDEQVVKEFYARKESIKKISREVQSKTEALEKHKNEIEEAKIMWLEPLRELIGKINTNFSYFFSCMKCVGEVDLKIPENPEDYEKYGVRIRVKYRDGELLRELNPYHQSGGERSVATVLYMMALQEMAKCPFRCVDEINQGMDPINERKVFELVVQTVCQKSNSQYFLLTPKLLPDLEYADNMMVLCVYNGPSMISHSSWKLHKYLRRRDRLQGEDD